MTNFTSKIVAVVKEYRGSKANPAGVDTNDLMPVYLKVVAGKSPNTTILSGTIAEREGFVIGKSYLIQITEREESDYGREFNFSMLGELSTMELLTVEAALGAPVIFDVRNHDEYEDESDEDETEGVAIPKLQKTVK
jgi:hypothetical protein